MGGALLLLGDSLAAGLQSPLAPIAAHTRIGASSFEPWERHVRPGYAVVLVVGSNDTPGPALAVRFKALVERLASGSGGLIIAGPPCACEPGMDDRLAAVAELQRGATEAQPRTTWLPLRSVTVDADGRCRRAGRTADGLHFTAAGYADLAAAVRAILDGGRR